MPVSLMVFSLKWAAKIEKDFAMAKSFSMLPSIRPAMGLSQVLSQPEKGTAGMPAAPWFSAGGSLKDDLPCEDPIRMHQMQEIQTWFQTRHIQAFIFIRMLHEQWGPDYQTARPVDQHQLLWMAGT